MDSPNFYAIIPAHVRYCKDLEPNAKLLYGEITALAQLQGYCWATNEYFSQLYDVDVSTIKRWLSSLKEKKFIEIETHKEGMSWCRRIWISQEVKKMFTKAQKRATPSSKMSPPQLKNEPHINTYNNTKEKENPPTPLKGVVREFGPHVKIFDKDYQKLVEIHGIPLVEEIISEMNDYISAHGKKGYKDYSAAIRNWIKMREKNSQSTKNIKADLDKSYAQIVSKKIPTQEVHIGPDYIEFTKIREGHFKFGEPGFKEKVDNCIRKIESSQLITNLRG